MHIKIRKIIPFSSVDGPGNRTVVFFQGCNMACSYCHNPETIALNPENSQEYVDYTPEDLVDEILKYKAFISGVTLSGGECTVQDQGLLALVKALKNKGLHVMIDSNGVRLPVLKAIGPYIDGVMLDVKAVDDQEAFSLTGVGPSGPMNSLAWLIKQGLLYEVRTVVHESLMSFKTIDWVCDQIKGHQVAYKIIGFRPHGVAGAMAQVKAASPDFVETCAQRAKAYGVAVIVR